MKINYNINVIIDEFEVTFKKRGNSKIIDGYVENLAKNEIIKILDKFGYKYIGSINCDIDSELCEENDASYHVTVMFNYTDSINVSFKSITTSSQVDTIVNFITTHANKKILNLYDDPKIANASIIINSNGLYWFAE